MSKATCKNFHIRRMNGMWWCFAPYDPTRMEAARYSTGDTPAQAYKNLLSLLVAPAYEPPKWTPRQQRLHEMWNEAECRQRIGMHSPWSALDCAVRRGGPMPS